MKNQKPIPKNLIPAFSYSDDENYIYDSLLPVTTQNIGGQYFNLITIDNICKFFEYFIKDDGDLNSYLEEFLSETIFNNSLIKTFFEDEQGWHATSFNRKTGKFNSTNLGCHELHFCRESFLRSVTFTGLYRNLDSIAFMKAVGIRRDYTHFVEDILDLKYYLETETDLQSASSAEKSLNKKVEGIGAEIKSQVALDNDYAGTAITSVIEKAVKSFIQKGVSNPKPRQVWDEIKSQNPLPEPINQMSRARGISYLIPTTLNPERMSYKTFSNRVGEFKKHHKKANR